MLGSARKPALWGRNRGSSDATRFFRYSIMEQHLWGPCSSTMCRPYGITSGHGPGCRWCSSMHSCCWVAKISYSSNIFAGTHKIEQQKSGLRWLSESRIWCKNYYGLSGLYLSVNVVVNIDKLFPCLPLSHTLKVTAQVPDWQLIIQGPINNLCLGLSPCMLHQLSSTAGRRDKWCLRRGLFLPPNK